MTGIQSIIEAWDLVEGGVQPPVTSWFPNRIKLISLHYAVETQSSEPKVNLTFLTLYFLLVFWLIS